LHAPPKLGDIKFVGHFAALVCFLCDPFKAPAGK
jgi:hypothetical protein